MSEKQQQQQQQQPIALSQSESEIKGWLLKWTNYIKGYQKRYFVLSNGVLSYYRAEHGTGSNSAGRSTGKLSIRRRKGPRPENQTEVGHTCRGTISLHGALIHTIDSCTFVISNGGTQTFHIKAGNEVERQSWVTALELAKAKAIRAMESEEDEEDSNAHAAPAEELNAVIKDLTSRLENLKTCYELIVRHGNALHRVLNDVESFDDGTSVGCGSGGGVSGGGGVGGNNGQSKAKVVSERATLFRISSNAMINACNDYLQTAQNQGHKWSKMLQHERDQRQHLEEMVEQLARQHSHLEKAAHRHRPNVATSTSDEDDNEFFDAQGEGCGSPIFPEESSFVLKIPYGTQHTSASSSEEEEEGGNGGPPLDDNQQTNAAANPSSPVRNQTDDPDSAVALVASGSSWKSGGAGIMMASGSNGIVRKRRTKIPEKPNHSVNLWSIMKNCIGKELSKIPMPVNFNEPLSMLQRLTEDYEYTSLLDQAAKCDDICEQLAYVAAFTISSYSTTSNRTGKPFNPLLGETYECDRTDDLGWRLVAEQVSHHPPMAAIHCEGKEWQCWQEFTMSTKFRGKYLQVIPMGNAHVQFSSSKNQYTWRKVTTTVNNIIVGKLWVDHHGDMDLIGEGAAKGVNCHLKYIPYSYFTRESQRRVKGVIMNRQGQVKWVLNGTWDNKIEIAPVISTSGSADSPVYKTGNYKTIWMRQLPAADCEKYYNFTTLACQLNEFEESVAPTDSRLRPDQRLMEDGNWNESNSEKLRLEEKQRLRRRQREADAEKAAAEGRPYPPYEPVWFTKQKEEGTDNLMHVYKGEYWEHKSQQDWSKCPTIF